MHEEHIIRKNIELKTTSIFQRNFICNYYKIT